MLTLHTVVTNALKARAENRLGAQRGHTSCLNRYPDGSRCVIGASIPDEFLDAVPFSNSWTITHLAQFDSLPVHHPDLDEMRKLQVAHDSVCAAEGEGRDRGIMMLAFDAHLNALAERLGIAAP